MVMDAATTTCDEFAGSCCGGGDPVVTNGFGIAPLTYLLQALHHITGKENNTHYFYNNKKLQKKQTLHSTSRRSQLSILPAYSSPVVPAYAARSAATHPSRLHNNLNSHTPALHYATLPPASPISKYPSLPRLATTTTPPMHSTSLSPASQP